MPTMQPEGSDATRDAIVNMRELGRSLRRSFGPIENDPLPPALALLLMQLALAEVLRTAVGQECYPDRPD